MRDLAILSARPDATDLARAPHRLFGHVDGREAFSAARWAEEARAEIAAAHAVGHLPILTGGTGLYLDTLLHGIAPVPDIDPAIRDAIRAIPVADAYAALGHEDPEAAVRLNAGDTARVARALEVVRSTDAPSPTGSASASAASRRRSAFMPASSCVRRKNWPSGPSSASTSCCQAAPSRNGGAHAARGLQPTDRCCGRSAFARSRPCWRAKAILPGRGPAFSNRLSPTRSAS